MANQTKNPTAGTTANATADTKPELAQPITIQKAVIYPTDGDFGPPNVEVAMRRGRQPRTDDMALWVAIRKSTDSIGFNTYLDLMDYVMCGKKAADVTAEDINALKEAAKESQSRSLPFPHADSYKLLKTATEVFLMANCGIAITDNLESPAYPLHNIDEQAESRRFYGAVTEEAIQGYWESYIRKVNGYSTLPYLDLIRLKLKDQPIKDDKAEHCWGILQDKLTNPCFIELIWNYWMEEGMLVQTINAISMRFQNRRGSGARDPLAHLELDPLRPLNNHLWGYLQDEQHRLSLARRVYEYDHHYGIALYGKAVPEVRGADSRSKFMEAFHNLLNLCSRFYKQDDNTMVIADGFPVLNGLKEVHLLLTQGQHNQYGDLPWTARQEMLMQQWLLARPEMREFLSGRVMVAYPEPWMERVDIMKKLQGWTDTPITHFRDLAVFGEKILLSARFGAWSEVFEPERAANWARYWRSEIQSYLHAYRAATGADLTTEPVDAAMPMVHLRQRLEQQRRVAGH